MADDPQPSVLIAGRNRGGRPRAPEPGSRVMGWVPQSLHDRLIELAAAEDRTVSALVREFLILQVRQRSQ